MATPVSTVKTPRKNRYKISRGKRHCYVVAQNMEEAFRLGRITLNIPTAQIKGEYCGHA